MEALEAAAEAANQKLWGEWKHVGGVKSHIVSIIKDEHDDLNVFYYEPHPLDEEYKHPKSVEISPLQVGYLMTAMQQIQAQNQQPVDVAQSGVPPIKKDIFVCPSCGESNSLSESPITIPEPEDDEDDVDDGDMTPLEVTRRD